MGLIIDVGGGGTGTANAVETVTTFAALPSAATSGVGAVRVTADTGVFYVSDGTTWNAVAGGGSIAGGTNVGTGTGLSFKDVSGANMRFRSIAVDATLGLTAGVDTISLSVASAPNVTGVVAIANGGTGQSNQQAALNNITNTGGATAGDVLTFSGGNAQFLPPAGVPTGIPNQFAYFDPAGDLASLPGWLSSASPINGSSNVSLNYQPNNLLASPQVFLWNVNIDPLQNSPNDSLTIHSVSANLDSAATGFNMGSAGNSVTLLNAGFNYQGNGSTYGRLVYQNWNTGFGNGTDPVTFNGLSGVFIGWNAAANVTVNGQHLSYSSSVSMDAAAISTANFSVSGYSETSQLSTADVYGYNAFYAQPNIGTIKNTHNFNGLTINPTITTFEGNAGYFGAIISGAITNQGTNGYFGIQVNPTITHLTSNSYGMSIDGITTDGTATWSGCILSSNNIVTTGDVKVLNINTLNGSGHAAIDSSGHHFLNVGVTLANGLGQANGNVIGGQITIPNGTAITTTDFFGNNLAFGINLGDGTSSFTSSSPVGLSAVGFVGQVVGDGDADLINFLLNGYAPVFNGNVTRINNTHNACFPNSGTGTLDESVLMLVSQPAGPVGTDNWGFRADSPHLDNYLPKLAIGTTNKKAASPFVLDIVGQTQTKSTAVDAGVYGHYVTLTSSTTADASNELFAFSSENFATVNATFTNSKVLIGSSQSVTRGDGSDDGTLSGICGHESNLRVSSGAGGVTGIAVSFLSLIAAISGTVTDVYHFYGQPIQSGGTFTNQYGIYLPHDAVTPMKNWLSGQTVIGGTSAAPTNADVGLEVKSGAFLSSSYDNAGESAITAVNGMIIYNTDLNKFRGYENGVWVNLV